MKHLLQLVLSIAVMAVVASNSAFGIAYGQEEKILNPWERNEQTTSAKKGDKASKKAKKTNKEKVKKANNKNVKQANRQKAGKADIAKVEHKETGQKKKYLFW